MRENFYTVLVLRMQKKCKWVSKTNVKNMPTSRIIFLGGGGCLQCVHGEWVTRRWGRVAHNFSSVRREQSHKTAWQCTSWLQTLDTYFFFTKIQCLVQWWDKFFSFISGCVEVRCTPSAAGVRCRRRCQMCGSYLFIYASLHNYILRIPSSLTSHWLSDRLPRVGKI
jgi:hypothetical protein